MSTRYERIEVCLEETGGIVEFPVSRGANLWYALLSRGVDTSLA